MTEEKNIKFCTFKCLQIGNNDVTGTKFSGYDLHLYLREKNIDAYQLVQNKYSNTKSVLGFDYNSYKAVQKLLTTKLFMNSDIIDLQLVQLTNFDLNYLPIMAKVKPMVFTLHDLFYLTGHCVHPFGCEKWKNKCFDCEKLDKDFVLRYDHSTLSFEIKKRFIQDSDISAIVASKWMEDRVKQSPIWKNKKVYRIPFGINQEIFKPSDKKALRKKFGIDENSIVIMFRADNNLFKGLDIIKNALREIKSDKKITLVTVAQKGNLKEFKNKFDIKEYGWINNDKLMSNLYQVSDIFLMPSIEESFGMMAVEAMSCKVPVLSINGTALPEVINSPNCGLAVEKNEFAQKLQELIDNPAEIIKRGELSFKFAKENYDKEVYVQRIIKTYQEIIKNHKMSEDSEFLLAQLQKYAIDQNFYDKFVFYDNKFWQFIYHIFLRPLLKIVKGKAKVKQKYDKIYL